MPHTEPLRILIVTPSLPYPPSWGFGIRVYQTIRYLAQRHHVAVVAYAGPADMANVAALEETGATVHVVRRDSSAISAKRQAQLGSLFSRRSFQRAGLYSPAMQATISSVLAQGDFDVIQVESSQMCGFNFGSRAAVILDEHNIEYELLYRTYRTERGPVRKLYNWIEYRKFRHEEQQSWRQATACVLTSPREEDILRDHAPRTPTLVVPNGVDIDFFRPDFTGLSPATPPPVGPEDILFVGVMHYRPNVDAAVYFIREVLPHILRQRPNARFTIVGGGAPEELRRLAGPNVVLTGVVPDTRPYLSQAGAVVVPMRMGSGTRLKVLEALAMGRPMVSTALGCEGIAAEHEQHLLVADEPVDFANSVLRVLSDQTLAARLGRAGRQLTESSYSWRSVLGRLEAFMLSQPRDVAAPRLAQPFLNHA